MRLAVLGYEAIVWGMSSGVIYHFDVACTFYVSLCSLATFWHDSLDMDRAMYRKAVVMLQLVAGLLSMFSLAYGLVMLVNDYSWEPMRKYVCCSNETAALMHSWPFERRTWHATAVRAGGPSAAVCCPFSWEQPGSSALSEASIAPGGAAPERPFSVQCDDELYDSPLVSLGIPSPLAADRNAFTWDPAG